MNSIDGIKVPSFGIKNFGYLIPGSPGEKIRSNIESDKKEDISEEINSNKFEITIENYPDDPFYIPNN